MHQNIRLCPDDPVDRLQKMFVDKLLAKIHPVRIEDIKCRKAKVRIRDMDDPHILSHFPLNSG
jgi:hypothetical protein